MKPNLYGKARTAANKGKQLINSTEPIAARFTTVELSADAILNLLWDQDGNDVKDEYVTNEAGAAGMVTTITPKPEHGQFTAIRMSAGQATITLD